MAYQASAASTSSAHACSASTSYPAYDVFISHRGPDVKNTFATQLYLRLLENRLQVFLDKPELLQGHPIMPQIQAAIQSASVNIAIFSPNYAESNWCLEELDLMVKSMATFLPVFYKVKPSVLRLTMKDGAYAEALRKLEQQKTIDSVTGERKPRYSSSTIENWRSALSHAADISGFELGGEDEEELLSKVVQGVLKNVSKPPLYVAKYPTGLEKKLQEFQITVMNEDKGAMKAKVVGIVGFGGVGKTTLAKEFFNRNRSHYNESSFLLDVRENSARMSLNYLQAKLIEDLKHRNIKIESADEGIETLKRNLSSCHALVVLDDVDDARQLEKLLPMDILSPESLILVTTRDRHVLKESGVSSIYILTGLNPPESKDLFCSYAFNGSVPPTEFTGLVDRFVTTCNGLPLSLKVIGALLCGENEEYWEEQYDRLCQTLPEEIQKRLRISYDSLSEQDRAIFLDIACFFLGENRDRAIRIWGLVGIQNLVNKCLLEVDSKNKIRMHDHVRDCARSIAEEKSMPRRLWHPTTDMIDELLEISSSAITEVRGISTTTSFSVDRGMTSKTSLYNNSQFCGIRNLQLLATEGDYVEPILRRVQSQHLRWLRWRRCSCTSLPDSIPMKYLKVLEVEGSTLNTLWSHQSKGPLELRELHIRAPLSDIPKSIGELKHLEWIQIAPESYQSITLEILPKEFCHLHSLKYLVLKGFSRLMSLPDSFGKLTNLQHINLEGASRLQRLPESFGNLTRLKHLCLSWCPNLTISNGTLGNIATLEYFNLERCSSAKELPPQVAHQRSLKELYLQGTSLKELPSGIGDLCSLEVLEIGNNSLKVLPTSLGNLKSLKRFSVRLSPKLNSLPYSFGMLTQLRQLWLEGSGIEYLPRDLPKFNNLESLRLWRCPLRELSFKTGETEAEISLLKGGRGWTKLDSPNDKCMFGLKELRLKGTQISEIAIPDGVCPNLHHIKFEDCQELRQIGELCVAKLISLSIVSCVKVEELGSLETLKSLEELKVDGCRKLKNIQGLAQLTKLRRLNVSSCHEIEVLPGVEHCMSLESLTASKCPKVKSIPGLGQLTKLGRLDVSGCHEIVGLPGVEHCMSLSYLDVSECPRLKSIPRLAQFTNLGTLKVSGCHEIVGLPDVEHCRSLESLTASKCPNVKSIPGLGQLTKLGRLDISGCHELVGLPGVEHCTSLSYLDASDCPRLKSITRLGQLTNLGTLKVSGCHEIVGLQGVEQCMSLWYLDASQCPRLKSIPGLGQLTKLRILDVSGCHVLEGLPGVEHCMSLKNLNASKCPRLKSIPGLGQLTKLQRLDVSGCHEIEGLPGVEHCMLLENLNTSKCHKLKNIQGLAQCRKLKELNVSGCQEIEGLPGVEHCMSLSYLGASKCPRLKSIPGLGQLTKLKYLLVNGCHEIVELPGVELCMSLEELDASDCPKLLLDECVLHQLRQRLKRRLRIDAEWQYKG